MKEYNELESDEKAILDILAMRAIISKERDVAMKNDVREKVHKLTDQIERLNLAFLSACGEEVKE